MLRCIFLVFVGLVYLSKGNEICGFTSNGTSTTISYQIHSWNDLREWEQTIYKGATYFKIDPHYKDARFCESQIQDSLQRPEGCFLLSHDRPDIIKNDYNTTEDVLLMLQSDWFQPYITGDNKLTIALCFKVDDFNPCDGSSVAQNWMSLVNELFSSYNDFIEENNFNIEFVLDGAGTAGGGRTCLQDYWRPWNYTWIIGDDPQTALFSDSTENANDRFQIMNTPVPEDSSVIDKLELEGEVGYGKFQNSVYPFFNWEPADQEYILDASDYYINRGIIHEPGFKFAINIDPVQFEIFAGSRSGSAWNYCMNDVGIYPLITTLSSSSSMYRILYSFYDSDMQQQRFSLLLTNQLFGDITEYELIYHQINITTPASDLSVIKDSKNTDLYHVILWHTNGNYEILLLDIESFELTLSATRTLNSNSAINEFSLLLDSSSESFENLGILASSNSSCSVSIQLVKVNPITWIFSTIGPSHCITSDISNIDALSVSAIPFEYNDQSTYCSSNQYSMAGIVSFSNSDNELFSRVFCLDSSGSIDINTDSISSSSIDVGTNSKIKLGYQNTTIVGLELHGEGYCWNNERDNKRADIAICDSTPRSSDRGLVLNYNFGSLNSWKEHVESSTPMSPCDKSILHGVYDFGRYPSLNLFQNNNILSMVEVHEGVSNEEIPDTIECGMAIPSNGIPLLDSWKLPNLPY